MNRKRFLALFLVLCMLLTLGPIGTGNTFAAGISINEALNIAGGTLNFANDTGHPWVVDSTTDAGRASAQSNIKNINNGTTTLTFSAGTVQKNKVLIFDWNVSSESGHDTLYFLVNGTANQFISGQTGTWSTVKYVVPSTGVYTFSWVYQKDSAVNSGLDCSWVDNVRIEDYTHVESVTVLPGSASVNIGFIKQLSATVDPANATVQGVTWSTENEALATVDANGVVTGVSQGIVYIMATSVDGLLVGESRITVLAPVETTGVSLNYTHGSLLVGDTGTLVATIYPALASYRTISWYTSDATIATVTTAGVVKGIGAGTVDITAKTQTGNFTATCRITVVAESSLQDQTHLTYTPVTVGSTTPMALGWQDSSYILYSRPPLIPATTARGYSVYLEKGKKISFETGGTSIVDTYLDLYDSNFNRVAYDDDEGQASYSLIESYMVPQSGTYYLLVSGYGATSKGSFNLYINEVPPILVTGVSFNQDTFTVPLNHTLQVPYSILPGDADIKGVTFTSSNESSITVDAEGKVTGVAPGSSVITVTTAQGGFTDTCLVSVGYNPVTSVSYDTDAVIIGLNKTKTLQYTVEPAEAQLRGVTFTSSNLNVATVSVAGVVTAVGLGNAVITVTSEDGGKTDTCSVEVVSVNVSTCASVTLSAGDVWGDGTGYQLLLDADADAYGRLFQKSGGLNVSGDVPDSVYNQFEVKIPSNADGVLTTSHTVVNNSITILLPAGVYDYCIANPTPNNRVWIADTNSASPGRYNNFNFEAGYSYTFVITNNNSPIPSFKRDVVTLTSAYTGAGLSKYNVDYSVSGTGGTLGGKTQLLVEEGYTLTAADLPTPVPDTGYHFVGWSVNPVGTKVNAAISYTATFAINTYRVVFKDKNGNVLKTQENIPYGSAATAPTPPSILNYHFTGWSSDISYVTSNMTVTAMYAMDNYTINLPASEAYVVALEGTSVNPVPRGGKFTFTVTLNPNYSNSTIVVKSNGTILTPVRNVYTIDNVTEAKTITVEGAILNNAVYTALDAALARNPAYADSNYIPEEINAFRNAITVGLGIARNLNVLSQPMIDNATAAINTAYSNLTLKPADYAILDTALALKPACNDVYYTPVTISAFNTAMAAGLGVSRSLSIISQPIVDNAAEAINTAFTNLVLRPAQTQFITKSNSSLVINRTTGCISGFNLNNNNIVANILAQFDNYGIITVTDSNGNPFSVDSLVGTGSFIKLFDKNGNVVDQVTVVVCGDTDGNGIADGYDAAIASLIAGGMLTQASVGVAVCNAADANHDGFINGTDVALIEQAGLFLIDLS